MSTTALQSCRTKERLANTLRDIYRSCGYTPYRMSKFEEYELYADNKDFLGEGGILTFTDTTGKLMALKPDVTLSIIKNLRRQSGVQKVFYNENVYRVSKSSGTYRELLQTGLECIGDIGEYELAEVLYLAMKTLESTGRAYRLDLSHMGLLSRAMDKASLPDELRSDLLTCIKRKNTDGVRDILKAATMDPHDIEMLAKMAGLYGAPDIVLPELRAFLGEEDPTVLMLSSLCEALTDIGYGDRIAIDPSIVHDMNYYSSLVFRGYVDGVPDGVLSGGSYDALMKKMGRDCFAIGFALSHDGLEALYRYEQDSKIDLLLLYDADVPARLILSTRNALEAEGKRVLALPGHCKDTRAAMVKYLKKDGTLSDTE